MDPYLRGERTSRKGVQTMTTNQLRFAELRETQRSNQAKEGETKRSNLAKESETARHNLVDESLTQLRDLRSYEVGSSQAAAQHAGAAAASKNADANLINAATRQEELGFAKHQYEDTGKNEAISRTDKNKANAAESRSKRDNTDIDTSYKRDTYTQRVSGEKDKAWSQKMGAFGDMLTLGLLVFE